MPKFVAQHLVKLPRVTPGEIDIVSLLERISMLEKAMCSMQQCIMRHDSALSAATNDNSSAAPARRRTKEPPAQMSQPTETASYDMARQLHNIRMIEIPQAAPPSTQTSAIVRQQPLPHSLKVPSTHAPATTRIADGQLWSDLASAVDTDPPADGFQIPKYHRK